MSAGNAFLLFLIGPWAYGAVLGFLMLWIAPRSGGVALLVAAVYTLAIILLVGWYSQQRGKRVAGE